MSERFTIAQRLEASEAEFDLQIFDCLRKRWLRQKAEFLDQRPRIVNAQDSPIAREGKDVFVAPRGQQLRKAPMKVVVPTDDKLVPQDRAFDDTAVILAQAFPFDSKPLLRAVTEMR